MFSVQSADKQLSWPVEKGSPITSGASSRRLLFGLLLLAERDRPTMTIRRCRDCHPVPTHRVGLRVVHDGQHVVERSALKAPRRPSVAGML
jgi:hypothetical protein